MFYIRVLFIFGMIHGIVGFGSSACEHESKIVIIGYVKQVGCLVIENTTYCETLEAFFNQGTHNLSNSCVKIMRDQHIKEVIQIHNISNVVIESSSKAITLDCMLSVNSYNLNIGTGFNITNSTNIYFNNLKVFYCGFKKPSRICESFYNVSVVSAFHIDYSSSITFKKVIIEKSYGYSIFIREIGSSLNLIDVEIRNNMMIKFKDKGTVIKGYSSGGGVKIVNNDSKYSSYTNISIIGGVFENNVGETEEHAETCLFDDEFYFFFGRGGGFGMALNSDVHNVDLVITNQSVFRNNSALWGGGINVKFVDKANNNHVKIDNIIVDDNYAVYFGGGIFFTTVEKTYNNHFTITKTPLLSNKAKLGGGLSVLGINVFINVTINTCQIDNNAALFGSGLFAKMASLTINNLFFRFNNKNWERNTIAHGALAVFESIIDIYGVLNSISNNHNTGFLLDQSELHMHGDLYIIKNIGIDGGGMAIYGNSRIFIYPNSLIKFIENEATNAGGGIFVDIPGPSIQPLKCFQLSRYTCFILPGHSRDENLRGNLTFINNTAFLSKGNSMFSTTLQYCRNTKSISMKDIFTSWKEFTFLPENNSKHIVTTAQKILIKPEEWNPAPGLTFTPSINLIDERESNVVQAIDINPVSADNNPINVSISGNNKAFIVRDNQINIVFNGQPSTSFLVEISVSESEVLPQIVPNVTLDECKFGFTMNNTQCVCDDVVNFRRSIAQCIGDDVYISNNFWIPNNFSKSAIACPWGYCKSCHVNETITGFECLLNISHQCAKGRDQTSLLCAKCLPGLSVQVTDNTCIRCDNKFSYVTVIIAAFLYSILFFILDLILLYLNRHVYTNYAVTLTFFYVSIGTILHSVPFDDPSYISGIIGDSASTGPGGLCLIDGLDSLQKLYIEYAMTLFVPFNLFVIFVIIQCGIYPSRAKEMFGWDAFYRTYNIASYYFWFGVVNVALKVLHPVEIDNKWRVFVYAEAIYGDKEHLPLLVISVLLLFLLLLKILGIILSCTYFYSFFRRYCFHITSFFDSYKIGYVVGDKNEKMKDRTWCPAFYFIGFTIISLSSIYVDASVRQTFIAVIFLFFILLLTLLKPFESTWMNIFEIFMMSLLATLALLIDSLQGLYCPTAKDNEGTPVNISGSCDFVSKSIILLVYLPGFVILVYLLYLTPCVQRCIDKHHEYRTPVYDEDEYLFPYRPVEDMEKE